MNKNDIEEMREYLRLKRMVADNRNDKILKETYTIFLNKETERKARKEREEER